MTPSLSASATRVMQQRIEEGAALYDRERVLWRLFPLRSFVDELLAASPAERIQRLETHLYAAQKLLASGRWNADFNRVVALQQAIAGEREAEKAEREYLEAAE